MIKRNSKHAILILAISFLVFFESNSQNTNCNVTVQFTTVTTGENFAPKHVLAVWVENSSGQFVRSLKVMANARKQYLYTWNSESAGNTVDAVTGSTITTHGTENATWNGKDINQTVVADGEYKIIVEFTEEHAQGPVLIIPFTKNTQNSDSTLNNATNFTNISIDYEIINTSAIDETTLSNHTFSVYPNPVNNESIIKVVSDKSTTAVLGIYSLNGQCVNKTGILRLNSGVNFIELNKVNLTNKLPNGTYLLRLEYDNEIKVIRLIKQ